MNSIFHARSSAKKYGGIAEDYLEIHNFIDSSKSTVADVRHRALYHHTLGPFLAERVFGCTVINSIGKEVSVRQVVEDHIIEDLGFIPPVHFWLQNMAIQGWMSGSNRKRKRVSLNDLLKEETDPKKMNSRPYPKGVR